MGITLEQIAAMLGGELCGDGTMPILGASPVSDANAGHITFLEDDKYLIPFLSSSAAAAIVPARWSATEKPIIRVRDPLMAFVRIFEHFHPRREAPAPGVEPSASVHPTAKLGADVWVGPHASVDAGCVIGAGCRIHAGVRLGSDCCLGDGVILYPNAVIYDRCTIGSRSIVHANAVIGADGFGFRTVQGKHVKIPQLGTVEIGEDVEIGAGATVDRATFGVTRIGAGSKIDNLVMIGHNCRIGKHNVLASQVGIAGSVTTGEYVVMAGQVGIADHLHIGDRAVLGAKCGIMRDVPSGQQVFGIPGRPMRDQLRIVASMDKLPEMRRDMQKIKEQLGLDLPKAAETPKAAEAA